MDIESLKSAKEYHFQIVKRFHLLIDKRLVVFYNKLTTYYIKEEGMKNIKMTLLAVIAAFTFAACGNNSTDTKPEDTKTEDQAATETTDDAKEDQEATDEEKSEDTSEEATGDKDFAGKTLTLAGLDGGYGTAGWEKVIANFEEMTGAKVEYRFEKNIYDTIRPEIQAGNAPDVIYNSLGQQTALTETMLKEDMVMEITDLLDKTIPGEDLAVKDKIGEGFVNNSITNPNGDDKMYLAPIFYAPTGLWYNKALFTEGGGEYELPETMEDFLALGEKAKEDGTSLFTYPISGYLDTFTFALMYEIGGQELFDKLTNYDVEAWKNEATPLFETVGKIVDKDNLNPNTVAQANKEGFTQNQLSVMKNESLFMPNGTWVVEEMEDAEGVADGFEWGFMPLPSVDGSDRYAFSWIEQIFVSKDAKEPELAKEFLAYLYSDEATKAFIENGGAVQPIDGVEELITDENQKLFYSIYDDGAKPAVGGWAAAPAVEGVDLKTIFLNSVDSVANGDMTVEEWQNSVVDAIQRISDAIEASK